MTANSPVVKKWVTLTPLFVLILAVGLVVSLIAVNELSGTLRPKEAGSVISSNLSQGAPAMVVQPQVKPDFYASPAESPSVARFLEDIAAYQAANETASLLMGWQAETARLSGLAAQYREQALIQSFLAAIEEYKLRRGWQADAARLSGLAAQYREQASIQSFLAAIEEYKLRRGWQADAARLTALAEQYAGE
jgi:hypothetical protein